MVWILSDAHSESLLDFRNTHKADEIIYLGDYNYPEEELIKMNILYVSGNCDFSNVYERITFINGKKTLLTHGHLFNVKYDLNRLYYHLEENDVAICMFGHTHRQFFNKDTGIIFINPGAFKDGYFASMDNEYVYFYLNNTIIKRYKFED